MSETVITLEKVSKMYRVFRTQRSRILDALGFPVSRFAYDESWAIRDISLQIKSGERVGLIGRNGAGKSTILKIIADLLQPTLGHAKVYGKVQTLIELGTGFHPEFSGRENILSSLAYQGVTGKEAIRLLEEIIDFSELDEYIDKPLKTYSSGMSARLAFASATAIRPEVLIIDEILGAGDAYFANKSTKRMRALTNKGTTVLFVSHDLAAVQMLCDRAIWIERGRIIEDGNPIEIGKYYTASIRKQEELKLRAINLKLSRRDTSELLTDSETERVFIFRFISENEESPVHPVRFYEISLEYNGDLIDKVDIGMALDDDRGQRIHLLTTYGYMNWSSPKTDKSGCYYREFCDCKGQYKHAPVSIRVPISLGSLDNFSINVVHGGNDSDELVLCQLFDGFEYITLGSIVANPNEFDGQIEQNFSLSHNNSQEIIPVPSSIRSDFTYGDGTAWIEDVDFQGSQQGSQRVFEFGEALNVNIQWGAKSCIDNMSFVVCIYGMDGRCISQIVSPAISATESCRAGQVQACFNPLMIGAGDYVISIGIFHEMSEEKSFGDKPLDVHDRQYRIKIVSPSHIKMDRGIVVHQVNWLEVETTI